jgi:hypothetical protein
MKEKMPLKSLPPHLDDALAPKRASAPFGASPYATLIGRYLAIMNAAGDGVESEYQAVLEEMRKDAAEVIVALAKAEACSDRSDYPLRWALVYAATQMKHEAALPYFRNLVLTPIPPEQSEQPHSFSTVREETILRTTAIEGLGQLATQGHRHAVDTLFEALDIPSISMRRAAVQALLAADSSLRERIRERLPRDFRFLLDLKTPQVSEAPQVRNPRTRLRKGAESLKKSSPPGLAEESAQMKRRKSPKPKIGGK